MYDAFYPGQVWLDTNGNRIQAHGGSLIYLDGVYYWYGENKEKTDKAAGIWHWGVRYYASTDLYNWEDRGLLIPPVTDDPNSSLHPTSMMDRPHIIYNTDSPAAENAVQKTYPGSEVVMENPGVEPLARRCYPDAYSMLGALRLAAPHTEFLYAQGYPYAGNEESGHDAALQIAKDADLVICTLGGHYGWNASCTTGEGIDAMHIGLPVCQERFLEKLESLHKPVVGVHFDGHPISSDTADRVCNAILEAWAPGAQGGEAIAALLTGTANPCGKLPCTVARHEGQIPVYYNHPTNTCYSMTGGTPKNAYIDGAHTPRYCFGHGLSYTKYEYDTLRLEKDAIQADGVLKGRLHVRNAGNKAGTEIVQFYVHDVAASMVRPVKELVGFAKVNLQPGEEKTVCLSLPMSQLAFLDADMRWKVEHGKVELMVGASSEDIRGKAEFMIVGDAYPDGKNRSFVADTKIM